MFPIRLPRPLACLLLAPAFLFTDVISHAQQVRQLVVHPRKAADTTGTLPSTPLDGFSPSTCKYLEHDLNSPAEFVFSDMNDSTKSTVSIGQASFMCFNLDVPLTGNIISLSITSVSGDDAQKAFKYKPSAGCASTNTYDAQDDDTANQCVISLGFSPITAVQTIGTMTIKVTVPAVGASPSQTVTTNVNLKGTGVAPASTPDGACQSPVAFLMPASRGYYKVSSTVSADDVKSLVKFLGVEDTFKAGQINCYYSTVNTVSYFGQIKQIFNGTANSGITSADVASLNFPIGMQMTLGTNVNESAAGTTPATVTAGTLSAASSAQAAQNILSGGTLFVSASLPILTYKHSPSSPSGYLLTTDISLREGVDLQAFTAGTTTSATGPTSHFSFQSEGYFQYNSTNLQAATNNMLGSFFVGGNYGYSYTSVQYQKEYGLSSTSNGIGKISAGLFINGSANVAISRGFGPSQSYTDSTTMKPVTVKNFNTWSFGITYTSATPLPKS